MSTPQAIMARFKEAARALPSAHRFTPQQLEAMYAVCYGLYDQGRYEQAARFFAWLAFHAPLEPRYLKALAASRFMARQYELAASTYALLVLLGCDEASVLCGYGHALLLLAQRDEARRVLELAALEPGSAAGRAQALLALLGP